MRSNNLTVDLMFKVAGMSRCSTSTSASGLAPAG